MFNQNLTILFQGDSITDVGRDRSNFNSLGGGYAMMAASTLLKDEPEMKYTFLNRGISGNRVVDLYARWKEDAINLKPDVLSIMIGINDTWHEFTRKTGVDAKKFERVYRMLLDETKGALPDIKLILIEPFLLPVNKPDFFSDCEKELIEKQLIIQSLADEYDAIFVKLQKEFDCASKRTDNDYSYWSTDGVHPTLAGHRLIADKWILRVRSEVNA